MVGGEAREVQGQINLELGIIEGAHDPVVVNVKRRVVSRQSRFKLGVVQGANDLISVDVAEQTEEGLRWAADRAAAPQAHGLAIGLGGNGSRIVDRDGVGAVGDRVAADAIAAEANGPFGVVCVSVLSAISSQFRRFEESENGFERKSSGGLKIG